MGKIGKAKKDQLAALQNENGARTPTPAAAPIYRPATPVVQPAGGGYTDSVAYATQPAYPPPPPLPVPRVRLVAPFGRAELINKASTSGEKRFLGLLGDAATLVWLLGVLKIAASICVVVWCQSFLKAFEEDV